MSACVIFGDFAHTPHVRLEVILPEIQLSSEPPLLAEIEYRAKSAEGKVGHLLSKGVREDL
jgi:hypothetical protein